MMQSPLAGFAVLDMTEGVAGPVAASVLGDMGADVVKIERPTGDWLRARDDELSPYFVANNRNKRDLCLDLQRSEAAPVVRRLVERCDVVVSNYRRGVMDKLGLGYDACRAIRANLIYCTISAFGQRGAYADRPASDTGMQGLSGMMHGIGEAGGEPLRVSFPLIDIHAGNLAVQGVLLALLARERGAGSARIDVSLLNAALSLQAMPFAHYQRTGELPQRSGNQNPVLSPAGAFRASDGGYMTVTVLGDPYWERFARALQLGAAAGDARFRSNSLRVQNREALHRLLEPIFASQPRAHWLATLAEADILCYPINSFEEVIADAALVEPMALWSLQAEGRDMRAAGNPIQIGGEFAPLRRPPPRKGEHSREILAELGYSAEEVKSLLAKGIAYQERSAAP